MPFADAVGASITLTTLNQPGVDSLAFVIDSVVTSTSTGTFNRYRVNDGSVSSMASTAPPNSNLVANGNQMWFTRRQAPYRIARADLTTTTGNVDNFTPPSIVAPFDDMALGTDSALWATSFGSNRIARVPLSGGTATSFSGNARTQQQWKAWVDGPIPLAAEVCRFYGSTDIDPATEQRRGPNSHFYTLDPAECAAVKNDAGWTYEFAGKFWLVKPVNGVCATWTQPIYRVYNSRFAQNDSNHRYMTSVTIYNQMRAAGWSGEGVVACAPLN